MNKLPRRERFETLIKRYPHDMVSYQIHSFIGWNNLEVFNDESIEEIFASLRNAEQWRAKTRDKNSARAAS